MYGGALARMPTATGILVAKRMQDVNTWNSLKRL